MSMNGPKFSNETVIMKAFLVERNEVLTNDGLENEPESLKSMLAAFDRHFKERDYRYSIISLISPS